MKVFTLPIKTISEANARSHWAAKAKRVADQRGTTALALRAPLERTRLALAKKTAPPMVVTLMRVAPSQGLDDDNLRSSLKAVRDGVADALGVDDRDARVRWAYSQARGQGYSVTVTIATATEVAA